MALRLEQRIEVPEGRFHPLVRGHLLESHLHEYLSELGAYLEEGVEVPPADGFAEGSKVVFLERRILPLSGFEHLLGQVGGLLDASGRVARSAAYGVRLSRDEGEELPTLQGGDGPVVQYLGIPLLRRGFERDQLLPNLVPRIGNYGDELPGRLVLPRPFILQAVSHADFARVLPHRRLQFRHRQPAARGAILLARPRRDEGAQDANFL
mmetsp:Transcript_11357/g.27943  ORF Transcript_11357/g.27943 Transcript_11357/m.27943 type:complete len:209 (+) Transcript_11357:471-1097(+)